MPLLIFLWTFLTTGKLDPSITVKMLVENMQDVDPDSFVSNFDLLEELDHLIIPKCKPFGLVLISVFLVWNKASIEKG